MKSLCDLLRRRKSTRRPQRAQAGLESAPSLESRVLLATLVAANKLTYQDVDGDTVTVSFSKNILNAGNVNAIFQFNTSTVNGSNATPQQLQTINLVGVAGAAGTTITTTAVRSGVTGGDGVAALGQIDATGLDLGIVTLDGDLGRILAGDGNTATAGLAGLSVRSMGRYGTFTGAADLNSAIQGKLPSLKVKGDMQEAFVEVIGGANGSVGTVTIGGSMIGGSAANSGRVHAHGVLGTVTVGGDVVGGAGSHSGALTSFLGITSVTINGSLIGGSSTFSGTVLTDHLGGGPTSGGPGADIGTVKILGNLIGGSNTSAGTVYSESGKLTNVTINGSARGGAGELSGTVYSFQDMGTVKVLGDVAGGTGEKSGNILSELTLASLTIGGSLIGGSAQFSGRVQSSFNVGTLKVTGDVVGGSNFYSGYIQVGNTSSLTVGGSLIGGPSSLTGTVSAGNLGTVTIGRNLVGSSASGIEDRVFTGGVFANRIGTMTVGGSLVAGVDNTSGLFIKNGAVTTEHDIGSLTINGSLVGNSTNPALIRARGQAAPPATSDIAIGTLKVLGRVERALIHAGATDSIGANADAQIGTVTVGGDWIASSLVAGAQAGTDGHFGTTDDLKLGGAFLKDLPAVFSKINSITIGGQVIGSAFTADTFGFVAESIGSLKIGGDTTISLLAGNSNDDFALGLFGDIRVNEI